MRMFGRPKGALGKLGGIIMARTNHDCAAWVIDLLDIQPNDKVLEVGFGPGIGIQLLARSAATGYIAGVDPSEEMVEQAKARNAKGPVGSTSDAALPRDCHSKIMFSIRPWQSTPCKSGRMLWLDCKRCAGP